MDNQVGAEGSSASLRMCAAVKRNSRLATRFDVTPNEIGGQPRRRHESSNGQPGPAASCSWTSVTQKAIPLGMASSLKS
jgi:hypothetical protein